MTNPISVKKRLKNLAENTGRSMTEVLIEYGLERTIYRISISKYADKFTLKGGILLYALFDTKFARITKDIDLLAQNLCNELSNLKSIFLEIFSIDCDDAIKYELKSLEISPITEFKKYHGAVIKIIALLDKTRINVSIDLGFDDIVYPNRSIMNFPVLLNMTMPQIYVYSVYSIIAEKFEVMVSLGNVNSRLKDFYDVYILASNYYLKGNDLQIAVLKTFTHRHTSFNNIVIFENGFAIDTVRKKQWDNFILKKRANNKVEFTEVLKIINKLLYPITLSINESKDFDKNWSCESKQWE